MEWHTNLSRPSFVPRPAESSFNFLFNCNLEPFPGIDVKQQPEMVMAGGHMVVPPALMERSVGYGGGGGSDGCSLSSQLLADKKKRLTSEQLESLENSFQEEIKLDPDRKMKLARELGMQPRQVAVWFQNRRARWKTKQLERLYDSLKLEFDSVSREKQKLQDEVMKLRAMLMDQAMPRNNNHNINTKQVSIGCTEVSGGDETVESTSAGAGRGGRGGAAAGQQAAAGISPQQSGLAEECHYLFSGVDEYNTVVSPLATAYWAALPTNYPC